MAKNLFTGEELYYMVMCETPSGEEHEQHWDTFDSLYPALANIQDKINLMSETEVREFNKKIKEAKDNFISDFENLNSNSSNQEYNEAVYSLEYDISNYLHEYLS